MKNKALATTTKICSNPNQETDHWGRTWSSQQCQGTKLCFIWDWEYVTCAWLHGLKGLHDPRSYGPIIWCANITLMVKKFLTHGAGYDALTHARKHNFTNWTTYTSVNLLISYLSIKYLQIKWSPTTSYKTIEVHHDQATKTLTQLKLASLHPSSCSNWTETTHKHALNCL